MSYSSDADLVKIRPNILDYGVPDWTDKRAEAEADVDRDLDINWYRDAAERRGISWTSTPFNNTLILTAAQVKKLSIYKTFVYIYEYLMKDSTEPDAFERQRNYFAKRYREELADVLAVGIDYDWDSSGAIEAAEKYEQAPRMIRRM